MSKKIMILNGSPRKRGNTSALIDAFSKGAIEAGNSVSSFLLNDMNIHGCKGCFGGGKDAQSPCVQKDDMDNIYPHYIAADIVVLASPLYYWTISGQLKSAFDRLFAVAECNKDYANPRKDAVLLMAAEGDGFEESIYWYERLIEHIEWTDLGQILVSGVMNQGDITGHPKLEQAYQLGLSIK